jgi:hypothetical protein|tara:strand:+ start:40 stop:168 length:129 start_codon:yes stop_codon:yes gene_type:complete
MNTSQKELVEIGLAILRGEIKINSIYEHSVKVLIPEVEMIEH